MILITGCGCSGTTYIYEVLKSYGLNITHDNGMGRDGIITNAVVNGEVWVYNYNFCGIKEYIDQKYQ